MKLILYIDLKKVKQGKKSSPKSDFLVMAVLVVLFKTIGYILLFVVRSCGV